MTEPVVPPPSTVPPSRAARWPYWLGGSALLLGISWGLLAGVAPGLAKNAASQWAQGIGRQLVVGDIHLRPWSMELEINNLRLSEGNGQPLFAARQVLVNADPSAFLLGRWQLSEFRLEAPQLWVERNRQGQWNWARFVADASGPAKPESGKKSELPKLLVQEFAIQQGQVQLSDQLGGAHERFNLSPVNFRLTDLSTLPENGAYTLHAVLADGAQFDWKGSLRLQPLQSSGEARVRGFRLASIWDYVKPQFAVAPPKGELALQARYQFDLSGKQAQLTVAPFAAKLNHLQLTAPTSGSVIRLPQLALNNGRFDLQRHAVNLGQVTLSGAQIALQRQSNGLIDWQAALPPSKPTAPSPAATPAAPWSVQLPSLRLENWALDYTDHGFALPLQVNGRLPLLTAQMALTPKTGLQLKDVTVALADWQLGAQHAKPVVTLQQAHLAASQFSLQQHTLQPGKLSLSGLEVLAERNRQGRINLQQLLQPAGALRPAVAKAGGNAKAAPAWKLHYPPLELTDSRLQWNDASPAQPVKLALEAVSATLDAPEHQPAQLAVSGKLGSGTLSAQLALDLAKAAVQGRVTAAGVPLPPVAPYALATTPLRLSDGTLSANLAVAASARNWQVNGQAGISRFKLQEPGQRKPLLGWRQLAVNGLAVQGQPLNVAVREVRLIDPSARLILDAQRQLNVVKLFSGKSAASSKPAVAAVKTATMPVTAPPAAVAPVRQRTPGHTVPVNVRTVRVQGGNVEFADLGMNPNFATHMHRLRGSIQGLSTLPGRRGTVTLDGDVDRYGDVRVRGSLAPLAVTDDTDITLAFRNIPLNSLNPYSMTFAGWKINDGRLTVDLRYLLQQRQLKGQNRVVIDTIQLGDEIPDYKGPHLPLRLAVALLEDSDGRIDLELPVSGNLDDPHFSYGKVIWHAFTNIITKVVTAPFRALGALFGGEGFDDIRFIAGEAAVSPPEREKLDKVAGAMAKRPKMLLQLAGGFDPVVDSKELARARIDRAILQVAGRGVAADEPLPVPDLADPAIQSAVKTVFGQRVGRMRLMTWTLNPRAPSGAALARALHDEMLAKEGVDNTALQALAHARAENAKRVLLRADNTLAERISVLPPVKAKAGQDGVPLEVKLATR